MPIAAHGERRSPDAAAEIEGEDLRIRVTAKLQRHESKQHALARYGFMFVVGAIDSVAKRTKQPIIISK